MSAITKYLTVTLVAVSLSACHTYRTPPRQLATPRPEDLLIHRSRPWAERDTIGIGLIDKRIVVRSTIGTGLGTISGWLLGAKWSKIKLYHHPHPALHEIGRGPVRITKRR
jgi:hypothetical protein